MPLINFDRVLIWSDFREIIGVSIREAASIGVAWQPEYEFEGVGRSVRVRNLTVTIVMPRPEMNTVIIGSKTDRLLKHEQGHYDIIALGAREFFRRGSRLQAQTYEDLEDELNDLHEEIYDNALLKDERYDVRTLHNRDQAVQRIWDVRIEELKRSPTGTVDNLPE